MKIRAQYGIKVNYTQNAGSQHSCYHHVGVAVITSILVTCPLTNGVSMDSCWQVTQKSYSYSLCVAYYVFSYLQYHAVNFTIFIAVSQFSWIHLLYVFYGFTNVHFIFPTNISGLTSTQNFETGFCYSLIKICMDYARMYATQHIWYVTSYYIRVDWHLELCR